MFKRFPFLGAGLLALSLLAPGAHVFAQQDGMQGVQADAAATDWRRLLKVTSIERMVRELPTYFRQGLDQARAQGAAVPPEVEAALKAAADEVFGFEGLQQAVTAHLQASLSAEQLADWLGFYATPLGRKLTAADEHAASPAFQREMMERAPQIMETLSQDASRMALLQSWLQATDAVEQATNMALQSQLALEWGLISTLPQGTARPSFDEVQSHMNAQRFAMRAQMAQMLLVHSAAAYQEFDTEELGQLLKRANSPAGRALYIEFGTRFYQTLAALSEAVGEAAGRRLGQRPV